MPFKDPEKKRQWRKSYAEKQRESSKRWRDKNSKPRQMVIHIKDCNRAREYARDSHQKLRKQAIATLGGKCLWCGYDKDYRALQVDHIEPILKQYRGDSSSHFREVVSMNEPFSKYQLLCANCHSIKSYDERHKYHQGNKKIDIAELSVSVECKQLILFKK